MIKNIENYNELEMRMLVASKIGTSIFDVPYIQSITDIERLNVNSKEVDKVRLIRYWKGGKVHEIEIPKVFERDLDWEQELKGLIRDELELTPEDHLYDFEITNEDGIYPIYSDTDENGDSLEMQYDYPNEKLLWIRNNEIVKYESNSPTEVIEWAQKHLLWEASDNSEKWFENYYECGRCGEKWVVDGDSMHEDDCPECGRTMMPYNSIEIEER